MLDHETATPITTETLAYGQRLEVIGMPCAPEWHQPGMARPRRAQGVRLRHRLRALRRQGLMNGSLRLGIDVGGTNTDAVVVDGSGAVLATRQGPHHAGAAATASGRAIEGVVATVDRSRITQAMLGTTHPANAIIQRRGLDRVGILRLAAPGSLLGQAGLRLAGRPARRDHGPHDDRPRRLRVRRPRDRAARPRGDQALRGRVRRQRQGDRASRAPSRPPTSTTSSGRRRSCARSWAIRSPSRSPTRSARWASWSARTRPRSTPRCCRCPTRS